MYINTVDFVLATTLQLSRIRVSLNDPCRSALQITGAIYLQHSGPTVQTPNVTLLASDSTFSHTPALMLVRYGLVNVPVMPAFADAHKTDARARRLRAIGRFRCIGDRTRGILNRLVPPCGGSHAFRLVYTFICALWSRYFPPFFLTSFSKL